MPPKDSRKRTTEGGLIVSAQQSRFHIDASDAPPTSKEIDVKDLTLTIGDRDLLLHANLTLHENRHYVLVGRNGTGKSTLLRALAEGRIPGVPWSLRILLLGQTGVVNSSTALDEDLAKLSFQDMTVIEHVIRSDANRERALSEARRLSQAIENSNDSLAIVCAIRQLKHERLTMKHDEMAKIAARRSGARGAKARKELIAVEEQVAASCLLLEQPSNEIDAVTIQLEARAAVDTLAEIQASLDTMDTSNAEVRARTVLLGLGFSPEVISKPFSTLSDGWRTRCSLASALFQKADILLLDECTNFLDLPAIIWLQGYVQSLSDTTVVTITHDRDFADAVAGELLVLREQSLEYFKGNLSAYEHERHSQTIRMTRMQAAQDKQTKHMESSIASALTAAKRTGDDKKLKQAASRRKKIEERTGLEVGLKGGRFKLNRDLAGYHTSKRDAIEIPSMDPLVKIVIPSEPPALRFPGALVSLEKVTFTYPRNKVPTLDGVDLVIYPGERVGIAGLNGSGKSTLVNLIMGAGDSSEGGLRPTKGTATRHVRAKIQFFSQHSIEVLEQKAAADRELTALREMAQVTGGQTSEQELRGLLGGLGLPGKFASDVPVAALSGGQKVRLALARLVYSPPHLLVLDEVTTHLDSDTVLALTEALKQFQGALLIITHDRFFMRCVVEGESPNEATDDGEEEEAEVQEGWQGKAGVVYLLRKGKIKRLDGGMREYEAIAERASKKFKFQ